jgi:aminopeptidase N
MTSPLWKRIAVVLMIYSCFQAGVTLQAQITSQRETYTRADTLRGSIGPARAWWDATWYAIDVTPDYSAKRIRGSVTMDFRVLAPGTNMQIDLQEPMRLTRVRWRDQELAFQRDENAWFIQFPQPPELGTVSQLKMDFEGTPQVAVRPPWDGGWIFARDKQGRPWMTVACQGLGASAWFPCKDHQSDEPDSARLNITVPDSLTAVANGQLRAVTRTGDGTATWTWAVANPINTYNIIPYIGKYVHWEEPHAGEQGKLDCNYWVLDYNLDKAKVQFAQVKPMLQCFEHWFGPYPFYADGFKLVEAPHLGMEHQSAVAYGNGFQNGYRGRDLSQTGWGLTWDFIIIHESGHEWFGNNISASDVADMWIHESFTNYSETIYTECQSGKAAGSAYIQGVRALIENTSPIVGRYGVNEEGSGDMYYKGGNMVHYLRQLVGNDSLFRMGLRGMNQVFRHKTVGYQDILSYWNILTGKDFTMLFDQYLRDIRIPVLQWQVKGKKLRYRWTNCIKGYNVAVQALVNETPTWLNPTAEWTSLDLPASATPSVAQNGLLRILPDFYCLSEEMKGK